MSDGKVVIEILGDTSEFTAKVEKLGSTTQSALSSVSSTLTGWGVGLTAAVTTPLAAAGTKAMQWALTTASAAEQADIAFSTMLGPEKAKAMIADLTNFAKTTPFEMSGLTDATQKLLAYGFAAEDVIPTLTAIGDATAALGTGQEGIDACTRAIGQMQAKGKVMSEEMLQLTEQGVPAWKYLAQALGTDVAGAQEKVTAGAVDAATGIAALKAGMEGDFGGLMAEQSKTLSGALSNLGDAAEGTIKEIYKTDAYKQLAQALADLAGPVGDLVSDLMPAVEGAMSAASGVVSGLAGAVSSIDPSQAQALVSALGLAAGLGPSLIVAGKAVGAAADSIGAASKVAGAASKGIGAVKAAFESGGEGATGMAAKAVKALGAVKSGAGNVGAAVELGLEHPLQSGLIVLQSVSASFDNGMLRMESAATSAGNAIVAGLKNPLESLKGAGASALSGIASGVKGVAGLLGQLAPAALGVATGFGAVTLVAGALAVALGGAAVAGQTMGIDMSSALAGVASAASGLAPLIEGAFTTIAEAAPQAAAALAEQGPAIAQSFGELLSTAVSGMEEAMPGLVEVVGSAAQLIAETLVACAPTLLEGGMQLFAGLLQALAETATSLGEQAPTLIGGLASSFAANAPTLLTAAGQLFLAISQALPQILPSLVAAVPTVVNGVATALPGFIGTMLSAAVNLFIGIVRALPQILPSLLSSLGSVIGSAVSYLPTFVGQLMAAALTLFLAVAQAVPQTVGNLLGAIGNLLSQAKNAFSSFSLADVGRQMIQGLIGGIQSAVGGLVNAAKGAAESALDAAKNLLGIHSPSRRFRKEVGRMIPLGAAEGVEDEKDAWRKSVDRAFDYTPDVDWPRPDLMAMELPEQPTVDASYTDAARAASAAREESSRRTVEELGAKIDAAAEKMERALGEPVSLNVDRREAGRLVRDLMPA